MPKLKRTRTPSSIMADMIKCGMITEGLNKTQLAKRANFSINTVCADLNDPERIPQKRLWIYFLVLGLPMNEALQAVADKFAENATKR